MMIPRIMHWPPGARRSGGGQDGRCVQIVWTDGVKRCEQGTGNKNFAPHSPKSERLEWERSLT